jgi:hypothetical protein
MKYLFRKPLYILIILFWVIGFNSCKRCTSCEVKDSNGNTIQEPTKSCGRTTELEQVKNNAQVQATSIGGSFECVDEI